MSKFEKLYNIIMEGKYSDYDYHKDAGDYFGKARYNANEFGDNVQMQGMRNGNPVVNPMTGEPVYWKVTATHYNCFDAVTGNELIAPRIVFELAYGSNRKNNIYVDIETYKNAYETGDKVTIAKLKALGLEPEFDFGDMA